MAKRGRPRKEQIRLDHDHKAHDEVPLSEESRKKVEQGLKEAGEGKTERLSDKLLEERKEDKIIENDLVEENNNQINKERRDKLNDILREINKDKPNSIKYANTIEEKKRMSFGYTCLDKLTGGGILCGNFTTLWGSKGCGKSTIAYSTIAAAQQDGKIAAYLDVERSYDPKWAAKFGVDTESLVYIACKTAEEVLDIIIKLCREKVVDLIVLDSIQGLTPHGENYEGKADKEKSVEDDTMALLARKLSQFFRMAAAPVSDAKCAVLLIGQARMDLGSFIKMETLSGGHALMHNSRLILRVRRGQGVDAPVRKYKDDKGKTKEEKLGFDLVVHVDKSQIQGCTELSEIHVPFYFDSGIKE